MGLHQRIDSFQAVVALFGQFKHRLP